MTSSELVKLGIPAFLRLRGLSSDYITPFLNLLAEQITRIKITDVGKPINDLGEQTGYGGCNASMN